jgi:glycosyl transferase family 87
MTRERRRILFAAVGWLVTRIPMYLMMTGHLGYRLNRYGRQSRGDVSLYSTWVHESLNHLVLPATSTWQYPPLVGPLLMLPQAIPGTNYTSEFIHLAFLADAVVIALLIWTAVRRGSWLGAWYWIVGVPLLGPLIYGRFDVFSALPVVAALALLGLGVPRADGGTGRELNSRRWIAGVLIGLGAALKIWPGMALFGLPRTKRGLQTAIAAVVGGGSATLMTIALFKNSTGFVKSQGGRGVEIESVWAVPFLLLKHLGLISIRIKMQYGSFQILGHGVGAVETVALFTTVVAFAALGYWWLIKDWRPAVVADATLVGTLLMIITSRVISPQYMIWLLGVAAFCLMFKDTSQRRSALVLLISLPLSQADFPHYFNALVHGHAKPALLVAGRDLLLVLAAWMGFADLWRSTVTGSALPWRRQWRGPRASTAPAAADGADVVDEGAAAEREGDDGDDPADGEAHGDPVPAGTAV